MPCRSTKCHHGFVRFNASIVGPGYVCREGQQSVCHGLEGFNLQFLTGTLKCVPGEFHLGYVMTSCLIHLGGQDRVVDKVFAS